ncbi:methyl-accepting chemotaxis protein [Anaeromyxobacter sp. Fw109-5]|uniref:methyl-accepting chemotaxis protein n=1 Tax=Anaeromyxobacter sp. (strain Fw109-5) TaxID=404589 RepID=UPI0000ED7570|nr:methyl-accepting chemotaxis protein [Anaeromyxobacter sp. Fw109-5]ABS26570.1 methyl-accepting chemotaxis sensory transducer [Anaeromyxobacter sp. Fw109-5]
MNSRFTFSQKLTLAFALVVAVALAIAGVAVFALREAVARKDEVIDLAVQHLVNAERLNAMSFRKAAEARAYLMSSDARYLEAMQAARTEMRRVLDGLLAQEDDERLRRLLEDVGRIEEQHGGAVDRILAEAPRTKLDFSAARLEQEVRPLRERLNAAVESYIAQQRELLDARRRASTEAVSDAIRLVMALSLAGVALAGALAWLLGRTLARQIAGAVRHVETSSAELKAAAGQQATGAKQQASAMAEITTTINELLATSRQISESAQRVASIASDTAAAARTGDHAVQRSQEAVGGIRRQVELIVNHMLDLGRRSQQIGGVVEIINELAEQTNILAINATIEAAGAGEAGRRFQMVAEEIRKLADRVAGSTKDVRVLVDEIRASVNTTVMATESGSKAAESGARQFAELAAAFSQIARLVGMTTDSAREIELSTKQQATAVEQVNEAIANVAQATREAEASSGQSLQTASELATMSRDLARLVQTREAA